jgi:hypothetical protein
MVMDICRRILCIISLELPPRMLDDQCLSRLTLHPLYLFFGTLLILAAFS